MKKKILGVLLIMALTVPHISWATANGEKCTIDGCEREVILIENEQDLRSMEENGCYRLANDLTLDDVWNQKKFFNGHFDGGGHKIEGLILQASKGALGFWTQLHEKAVVKELIFVQPVFAANYLRIENSPIGFIAGTNSGQIENCVVIDGEAVAPEKTASYPIGGLVGRLSTNGLLQNCVFTGTLGHPNGLSIGGIAATAQAGSQIIHNLADVSFENTHTGIKYGAILSGGSVQPQDCYATERFVADKAVGLLTAENETEILASFNENFGRIWYLANGQLALAEHDKLNLTHAVIAIDDESQEISFTTDKIANLAQITTGTELYINAEVETPVKINAWYDDKTIALPKSFVITTAGDHQIKLLTSLNGVDQTYLINFTAISPPPLVNPEPPISEPEVKPPFEEEPDQPIIDKPDVEPEPDLPVDKPEVKPDEPNVEPEPKPEEPIIKPDPPNVKPEPLPPAIKEETDAAGNDEESSALEVSHQESIENSETAFVLIDQLEQRYLSFTGEFKIYTKFDETFLSWLMEQKAAEIVVQSLTPQRYQISCLPLSEQWERPLYLLVPVSEGNWRAIDKNGAVLPSKKVVLASDNYLAVTCLGGTIVTILPQNEVTYGESHWAENVINEALTLGVIDQAVAPDMPLSAQEFNRLFHLSGVTLAALPTRLDGMKVLRQISQQFSLPDKQNINDLQQFDDYAGLSEADYQSVLYCVANGLIVGDERKLRCEAPLTQAEGVAMLLRFYHAANLL